MTLTPLCQFYKKNIIAFIIFIIAIIGASYISFLHIMYSKGSIPYFYELIIDQTNGIIDLCFILPIAWLLIAGNSSIIIDISHNRPKYMFFYLLGINVICIVAFIVLNFLLYLIASGFKNPFINFWFSNNELFAMGFMPLEACFYSVLLLFIRMLFLSLLSLTINILSNKQTVGLLCVLAICVLDWKFYEWAKILNPLGILPIEHSRLVYTEGYAPMISTDHRLAFWKSLLYWSFVLSGLTTLLIKLSPKRENSNEKCKVDV